jgi:subtilase family serine protease
MHSRNAIRFSGSAAQVENAFRTEMHYYNVRGEKHMAPGTALSVPSAMAGVVSGVRNLDDFRPHAQHVKARPGFTSGSSGNVFFAPGDIVTTYDIGPLYTAGVDGGGQTIAIMGQSFVEVADIEAFQNAAGLTVKDPTMVYIPGSGTDGSAAISPGDEGESDLDLEWSGAIAPGANIVFVYPGNDKRFGVYDSAQYAVDNQIGNIISLSYSTCETQLNATNLGIGAGADSDGSVRRFGLDGVRRRHDPDDGTAGSDRSQLSGEQRVRDGGGWNRDRAG